MKRIIKLVLNLPVAMIVLSSYLITDAILIANGKMLIFLGLLWIGFFLGHWHGKRIR